MKVYLRKRVINFVALAATTGALVLTLAASAQAQRGNPVEVFNRERARIREEDEHRRRLEHIRDEGFKKPAVTDPRLKLALLSQIKEDFALIQVLNNEMIRLAFVEKATDYETIAEKAADVKKRASRLRGSIRFDELKDEKKRTNYQEAGDLKQLKISLILLRQLINRFVNSPMFQNPGVIDAQRSTQTSRDIRDIVEISEIIRKGAKKLDKSP
jgi:hypothetical protein